MDLVLQGGQGKPLTVSGDTIKIEKKGLLTGKREKTIPIRGVTSVEVKQPGAMAGFIQFSIAGGKARDSSYTLSGGAWDAAGDENSVLFGSPGQYEIALKIKEYVESSSARVSDSSSASVQVSTADEIRKLKALLDEGLLTLDEFNHKKRQLLGL